MADWIVVIVLLLCVGGAVFYLVKQKKKGKKCIGCPYADSCTKTSDSCGEK